MKNFLKVLFCTGLGLVFFACTTFDTTEAYASFSADNYDDTKELQTLLSQSTAEITVPKKDRPYIVSPITLKNVQAKKITLEEGVVILAKKAGFKGENECLLTLENCRDITVSGFGAVLQMRKADYKKLGYTESKSRHAVSILGGADITVQGLTIIGSGGDGIFIGESCDTQELKPKTTPPAPDVNGQEAAKQETKAPRTPALLVPKNVRLFGVSVEDSYRNAVAVSSVNGLSIEACSLTGSNGSFSSDGIAFEPTEKSPQIKGTVVKACVFSGNRNSGIKLNFSKVTDPAFTFDITFENCISTRNKIASIAAVQIPKRLKGTIRVINCTLDGIQLLDTPRGVNLAVSY